MQTAQPTETRDLNNVLGAESQGTFLVSIIAPRQWVYTKIAERSLHNAEEARNDNTRTQAAGKT